jgi:1-aminocyclopropane-1-carboxylate deaminase
LPESVQIKDGIIEAPGWKPPSLQWIDAAKLSLPLHKLAILRLDEIHPLVSGNKWFKLHLHLQEAQRLGKTRIVTCGGHWSNHIVAAAEICRQYGLPCTGLIRGESTPTDTLRNAASLGMQLQFTPRSEYRRINSSIQAPEGFDDAYFIPEGGATHLGARGAADIAAYYQQHDFQHILCAVGTGTMMTGLLQAATTRQYITGINVVNDEGKEQEATIARLLPEPPAAHFALHNQFHWGGYAMHQPDLFRFMNDWFTATGIPSDFVYTGKLFYAFMQLARQHYFNPASRILLIHSGGLQGNASLPKGTLIF